MEPADIQTASEWPTGSDSSAESCGLTAAEALLVAQGEAEFTAGLAIEGEDFARWLRALDDDEDTPLPAPRGRHRPAR